MQTTVDKQFLTVSNDAETVQPFWDEFKIVFYK